ncbi:MAG TPA: endo-1,4-beta-xylanase [Tepidisphaeraceae bacterium]|nr:endo-1,4-beta-xylanase [Tepidisphaeraceae bacterium]
MSLIFEIYREGKRLTEFVPSGAVAMGPESVPVQADISFEGGLLYVRRPDDHAIGVGLLWDAGIHGAYFMETTRLSERPTPYNLNVELARFRLMRIVQKQEDWNLFDFPRAEKFGTKFREAQEIFADALGKLHEPAAASLLADQALSLALELSEELGAFHADLLIQRRKANGAFVRHVIGCRVDPTVQNEKYRETLAGNFDYAIVPMTWRQMEPEEHAWDTAPVDELVELLSRKRMPIIAGPIIQLDDRHLPDWMFIWEHDFDSIRELAYEYVQKIVGRYRKAVSMWNVVAGLHTNSAFSLSFEQIIELTRLLVSQVKALLPNTRTLITVTQPFGEYGAKKTPSVPPMLYAEMVAQAGINFEAFGVEIEMGVPAPGRFTRDLFQLSCMLDRFSTLGRPLFVTAVGAPGRNGPDADDKSEGRLDPSHGGRWKRPWDPQLQAEWMEAVYHLALSKPYVESLAWGDLADISPNLPSGGLLDDVLRPKPAFDKLQEMRTKFHSWHGRKTAAPAT